MGAGAGTAATDDPSEHSAPVADVDTGIAAVSGLSAANRPAATLAHAESAAFTLLVTCTGEIVEVASRPAA